jgi:hypothetical protein
MDCLRGSSSFSTLPPGSWNEEELAVFDILTRPDINLSAEDLVKVKKVCRQLVITSKDAKPRPTPPENVSQPVQAKNDPGGIAVYLCSFQRRGRGLHQRPDVDKPPCSQV